MKSEIIINASTHETRIAILEEETLVEIWVERPENERMVGDIYLGKVNAVIPGIQAAFVDIGMEKSAFLHVSDIGEAALAAQFDDDDEDDDAEEAPEKKPRKRGRRQDRKQPPIEDLIKKDQDLMVEVTKEPISTKGARITSQVTLPGRFLVFMPGVNKVGVSRKISSWSERKRLRQLARKYKPKGHGVIIRTVAADKDEETIGNEIKELAATYDALMKKAAPAKPPALLHKAMGMTSGVIRDLLSEDVERVVVDSPDQYGEIHRYLESTSPNLMNKLVQYKGKEPIFDHYDLERQIENIFSRKVWLKSGAFLVMDHTEALTVIDVNSGRNTGKSNQEETITNINVESAKEIARQLRIRDIGGIIVIDFIDMMKKENRRKLEDIFAAALKDDRSKISISQVSEFGLMEMTRQRVRPSLIFTFAETCPTCDGIGMVQGRDTTVTKIERWLMRAEAFGIERNFTVFIHPALFEYLIENKQERLDVLRNCTSINIDIVADSKIGIDEFHVFSTKQGGEVTADYKAGKKTDASPQPGKGLGESKDTILSAGNGTDLKFGRKRRTKRR